MENKRPEILYSEPVKEIMGKPPSKILRWGSSAMFAVFIMLILFAWLIRYPDTIPASIEITTANPPVTLVTKVTGNIKYLYVKEREQVAAGDLLAVMETTASVGEIELLKKSIDTVAIPSLLSPLFLPAFSRLGELQIYYASFRKSLSDLNNYDINDFYGAKIISLSEEINGLKEYIDRLKVKEILFIDNQRLESKKFSRDSSLFNKKVIPESEMEASYQSLIRNNIELQQVRLDYSAKKIELSEKRQLLQDYRINRLEERQKLIAFLDESFLNLKAQLQIWENTFLLISPIDGIVSFTRFWSANQSVIKDEPVLNIIPLETGSYLGRINLKMTRSGKVKIGQNVNIKLSGYPYLEYGMVRGVVKSKSLVPSADAYIIDIELPDSLKTLYGVNLDFTQKMQGTAEILTENIRLLQKILNPFKYLISKNRKQ